MECNCASIVELKWVNYEGGYVLRAQYNRKQNRPATYGYVSEEGMMKNIENALVLQPSSVGGPVQNNIFGSTTFDFPF